LQNTWFASGRRTIRSPIEFAQRVLPDGCVDILLMNDLPMVGPWTEPFAAPLGPGTNIVGARCHPGLAPGLLGIPASEFLNPSVPLCEVWSTAQTSRLASIADEPTLSARMSAMEAALLGRMANARLADKATSTAIQWIARHRHGQVEQLSQWLGLSSRQIQPRKPRISLMLRDRSVRSSVTAATGEIGRLKPGIGSFWGHKHPRSNRRQNHHSTPVFPHSTPIFRRLMLLAGFLPCIG
jgi:hypothetical protein